MNKANKILGRKRWREFLLLSVVIPFTLFSADMGSMKSNIVTLACVNFHAAWGDKASNLERIKGYITAAAKRGADVILFPELALTGYDLEKEAKMHKENAETIPGPATNEIAILTRQYGVYVVFGMAEKDKDDKNTFFNSAAIVGPEGVIGSYAKLMPVSLELNWCKKGKEPFVFDTPWGLVGVGICYDSYMFPELSRYYAALGARLYLHMTAMLDIPGWKEYYTNQLRARAIENMMFVASSNLVGKELTSNFPGTSFIMGPGEICHDIKYYAGPASEENEEIIIATIDLAEADRMRKNYPLFMKNPISGVPDWRLKLFKDMLNTIDKKTELGRHE